MQFAAKDPEPPRPTAPGALGVAYSVYYDPYRWYILHIDITSGIINYLILINLNNYV